MLNVNGTNLYQIIIVASSYLEFEKFIHLKINYQVITYLETMNDIRGLISETMEINVKNVSIVML